MPSMYDSNVQNQIAQQQIFYLISQMEGYHVNNQEILGKLKQAQDLNQAGNVQTAASVVYVKKLFNFYYELFRLLLIVQIKVKRIVIITQFLSKIYKALVPLFSNKCNYNIHNKQALLVYSVLTLKLSQILQLWATLRLSGLLTILLVIQLGHLKWNHLVLNIISPMDRFHLKIM